MFLVRSMTAPPLRGAMEGEEDGMRTPAMLRLAIMAGLLFALMFPLVMVSAVISERSLRRDSAVAEVGESWGRAQTIGGPVLTIPYEYTYTDHNGKPQMTTLRAHLLP
jgi:inner membrane protein